MDVRLPEKISFQGNAYQKWKDFKQNFEIYLLASGKDAKPDKVKVATLLNVIGEEGVKIFNTFSLTDQERETYLKVLEAFEKFTKPKCNVVYERFVFYSRRQEEAESFDHFLTDIRKLSQSCEFGCEQDSMIRDRIVFGVNNQKLQEKLLNREKLDLDKAIEISRNNEISRSQLKEVEGQVDVDFVKKQAKYQKTNQKSNDGESGNNSKEKCSKCNRRHEKGKCPAYGKKCFKCEKMNHFSTCCKVKKETDGKKNVKPVKEVRKYSSSTEISDDSDVEVEVSELSFEDKFKAGKWTTTLEINKSKIEVKLDTAVLKSILCHLESTRNTSKTFH